LIVFFYNLFLFFSYLLKISVLCVFYFYHTTMAAAQVGKVQKITRFFLFNGTGGRADALK